MEEFVKARWLRLWRWPNRQAHAIEIQHMVAAYLRRCQTEGIFGAVRRRGAEEAGAVSSRWRCSTQRMLYAPAPQTVYDDSRPIERILRRHRGARAGSVSGRAPRQGNPVRSGCLDRGDRGQSQGGIFSNWRRLNFLNPATGCANAAGAGVALRRVLGGRRAGALAIVRRKGAAGIWRGPPPWSNRATRPA